MNETEVDKATLRGSWLDALRAAELADRIAQDAATAAERAELEASEANEIATLAEETATLAARAAQRARSAADRATKFAISQRQTQADTGRDAANARDVERTARDAHDNG